MVVPPFLTDVSDRLDPAATTTDRLQDVLAIGFFVAVAIFGTAVVLTARQAAAGLVDVRRSRSLEGTLLRNRTPWLAVDDGSDDDLRAFRAPMLVASPSFHLLEQGCRVRVTISPAVGYVRSIQRLDDPVVTPTVPTGAVLPPPPGTPLPPPPPTST